MIDDANDEPSTDAPQASDRWLPGIDELRRSRSAVLLATAEGAKMATHFDDASYDVFTRTSAHRVHV